MTDMLLISIPGMEIAKKSDLICDWKFHFVLFSNVMYSFIERLSVKKKITIKIDQ